MRKVKLDDIRIDGGTQGRLVIDQPTVYNYLEHMKEGDEFPKMFTVFDGSTYWLVDGFHRYHAYKLLGIKEIEIDYKPGTLEEAQVLSFGVNGIHGKPRSNEDKRKVVEAALEHPLTKHKSNYEIAKVCCVSQSFVAAVRNPSSKEKQKKNSIKHAEKVAQESVNKGTTTSLTSTEVITPTAPEPNPYDGAVPDEDEIKATELALQADQEAMHKLLESDDALATAHEEIKRLNVLNAQLSVRINGLMNERNEAVKMVKKLQNEVDKLRGKK
jgi:hypothetical protein